MSVIVAFSAAALVTYALRSFMTLWGRHFTDSERFSAAVALVSPAVLAAIVGSAVLLQDHQLQRPEVTEFAAVVAALGAVRRTGNVGAALFVGLPIYWIGSLLLS